MALTVNGIPITPAQLVTLQADLGIVVAEEVTNRFTTLEGTDDAIFLRAGAPGLASASVIAAFTGGGSGTQTLTPARFNNAQTFFSPTVSLAGGGGAAAYINHTVTAGSGSIVGTLPAGALASSTLLAIAFGATGAEGIATMPAPSGWTALAGGTANGAGGRMFTAPGNVGTLTFAATNITGLIIIATSAPVRGTPLYEAVDSNPPGNVANYPSPSFASAVLNDLAVAVYIQFDDGAGVALPDPGLPQAGYTRPLLSTAALPRISILSRDSLAAGATGTISHDANANFATRQVATVVFGA